MDSLNGESFASPEDLVCVRPADARERPLVAQEWMELASLAREDLGEALRAEAERVRPEMRELGLEALRREEPDTRALLLAALGEDELPAVRERESEHRRLRCLRPGCVIAQSAGAHQVDAEDELTVRRREEEVLAAAACSQERSSLELLHGWVEGLHGRDVRRAGALDRRSRDERVELAHPRLYFR